MLNMTSRTIRYYEQCGLIKTIHESKTAPRKLDDENIKCLRKIRFLRKLRLTLDEIVAVIDSETKATDMIYSKTAELKPYLNSNMKMLPPDFFENVWNVHIKPCGKFISVGGQSIDGNTVTNRLIFENLGVVVKTEVCGEIVADMVLQYFKETE